ncbi:E3 ubiquitin-protein ligase TRIM16-like isoform X2 [Sardina pilchardus]|uniref:E3 ubiquitin-protein ligase TRIM16-like isoform X2 n=1 Tax=Sardina pilchardus TaxID=27697 RepID=UPI002E0D9B24
MADTAQSNQDLFTCPICLDLLKDPVTILCGHTYCMGCIKDFWGQKDQKGVYSCPQCRQTFAARPVLNKNNIIAELVEQMRKTRIQSAAPAPAAYFSGLEDHVDCDVCTGRKLKAVKSCLDCLVSYCETHLKAHNDVTLGRKHNVVDATGKLQDRICTQHEKPLEIFCRTDQSCVCFLCMVDEHKGHDTVSASAGRKEKQAYLGETQRGFHQRIQDREKELQDLKKAVETLKSSAQTAVEDSERIFSEMIHTIEKRRSEVKDLIRAQEKAEVSQVEGLVMQLEQEIAELKNRDAELEQLSHTEDHIHFLKTFQSVSDPLESKVSSCVHVKQNLSFEAVKKTVFALQRQMETLCQEEFMKMSAADACCYFTLDPDTAHRKLHLSEGNRRVERRVDDQSYRDHPDRFEKIVQVLCREGVSGRVYWEVDWSGRVVFIAVSYKSIIRKGERNDCGFGCNAQSWRLELTSSSSSFWHDNKETKLPLVTSSRIGVYVDHRAGILALYSISDTMTLLHRVQTTFNQKLYPGFAFGSESSVKLL